MTIQGSAPAEQPAVSNANVDFTKLSEDKLQEELLARLNPQEDTSTPAPEAPPAEQPPADPAVTPEPEQGTPVKLEEGTPAPGEDNPEPTPPAPPSEEDLATQNEALKKQLENLQMAYGRQSNELGRLRQQTPAKPTRDDYDEDPAAATEQLHKHTQGQQQIGQLEQQQQLNLMLQQNANFHQQYTPELGAYVNRIKDVLVKQDKQSEIEANQFVSNILHQNPLAVYQLVHRAKAEERVAALEAQVAQLKQTPSKAVEQMSRVNTQTPAVMSNTGEGSDPEIGLISDPNKMASLTPKQLEAQLKARLKQEQK